MKTFHRIVFRRRLRPYWGAVLLVLLYWGSCAAFTSLADGRGLLTPSGVDPVVLLLGMLALSARLTAVFLAPLVVAYSAVRDVLSFLLQRSGGVREGVPDGRGAEGADW